MATFHGARAARRLVAHVKGAPGRVLDACSRMLSATGEAALDAATRARLLARNEALAARGLRVLALATGARGAASPRTSCTTSPSSRWSA